ncbi:MAG: hypothetical protein CFE45_27875, partial [Burkholderiales bacterium PBB5]
MNTQNTPARSTAIALPHDGSHPFDQGGTATVADRTQTQRVLRNTYALLSMTLLFSAAVAAAGVAFKLPA